MLTLSLTMQAAKLGLTPGCTLLYTDWKTEKQTKPKMTLKLLRITVLQKHAYRANVEP